MVAFGALALVAKAFFTPQSFYLYGHYRGTSVAEIASDKPRFMGSQYCESCHAELYAVWSKGVHHSVDLGKAVQCEVCHGAAGGRDAGGPFEHVSTGVDHPMRGKLPVPADSRKLCPVCHEKMAGRPAEQRQIVVASHAGTQQCTSCHNAHSPRMIRVSAAAVPQSANTPAGKAAACAGCHGAEGVSTNSAWPNLAGQQGAYLIEALKAYKSGARQNAMMSAMAKSLSDTDMRKLADYYAALKAKVPAGGRAGAGKDKAAACAGCHGANGVSTNPQWPSLAGQNKDYIVAALIAYKTGERKNDMMSGMVQGLSDADIGAVAEYYSGASAREGLSK